MPVPALLIRYHLFRFFAGRGGADRVHAGLYSAYSDQDYRVVAGGDAEVALKIAVNVVDGAGLNAGAVAQGLRRQIDVFNRQ